MQPWFIAVAVGVAFYGLWLLADRLMGGKPLSWVEKAACAAAVVILLSFAASVFLRPGLLP